MKNKPLLILLFLILLGGIAFLYINSIILPVKIREFGLRKAEDLIGRRVTFSDVRYEFPKGIVIENLVIFQKEDNDLPLINIPKLQFNILLPAVLRNQRIVIPSLQLSQPELYLARSENQTWNISDLIKRPKSKKKSPFTFFIGSIMVNKGTFHIKDLSEERIFEETVSSLDIRTELSIHAGIKLALKGHLNYQDADFSLKANYHPIDKISSGTFQSTSINIQPLFRFLDQPLPFRPLEQTKIQGKFTWNKEHNLFYVSGDLDIAGEIQSTQFGQFSGRAQGRKFAFEQSGGDWKLSGDFLTHETRWERDGKIISGSYKLSGLKLQDNKDGLSGMASSFIWPDAEITLPDQTIISANVNMNPIIINEKEDYFKINAEGIARSIQYRNNISKITGDLIFKTMSLAVGQTSFDMAGHLQIQNAHIDHTLVSGSILEIESPSFIMTKSPSTFDLEAIGQIIQADIKHPSIGQFAGSIDVSKILIASENPIANIDISASTDHAVIKRGSRTLSGGLQSKMLLRIEPEKELFYTGQLTLSKASATGIPFISELNEVSGIAKLAPDRWSTDHLVCRILDSRLTISGSMNPLAKTGDITLKSNSLDLKGLARILPEQFKKWQVNPSGPAMITAKYQGILSPFSSESLSLTVNFDNSQITTAHLPHPISSITGQLLIKDNKLQWSDLSGVYLKKRYRSDGKLNDFNRPNIEALIDGPDFQIKTSALKSEYQILFRTLTGHLLDSKFDLSGSANLENPNSTIVNIKGQASVNLQDLPLLNPKWIDFFKSSQLAGKLNTDFTYRGPLKDPRLSEFKFTTMKSLITYQGLNFQDFTASIDHSAQSVFKLTAKFYEGRLSIDGSANPGQSAWPTQLTARLSDSNLNKLSRDTPLKKRDLHGQLNAGLSLDGPLLQPKEWTGDGEITIAEGHIWEFNLLKGLLKALLIPELDEMVFTDASATFRFNKGRVHTNDLILKSMQADMTAAGWVDFDKKINFLVTPNFHETAILQSNSIRRKPTQILSEASKFINIKLSGTLDKPSYQLNAQPGKLLEKTTGGILKGVGGLLEDLLQN